MKVYDLDSIVSKTSITAGSLNPAEFQALFDGLVEGSAAGRLDGTDPGGNAEVLSRYKTGLDNPLYKALKVLRETQAWRRTCLEGEVSAGFEDAPLAA